MILGGKDDIVCNKRAIRNCYDKANTTDKLLKIYDDETHAVFHNKLTY